MENTKRQKGFSLIEVLVSAIIFIVGMIGVITLISFNIVNAALLRNRLIAANLAQEGIEIVRNIRDNNFLASENNSSEGWNQGLNNGNWRVDYNSQNLILISDVEDNPPLYFHPSSGLYDYYYYSPVDTIQSIFSRRINIVRINNNEIRVKSIVTWRERNRNMSMEAEAHLFNWK